MLSLFFFVKSEICIPKPGSSVLLNTRVPSEVNLANVIKPEGTSRYKALTKKLKCSLRKWSVIEPREGWRRSKLSSHCRDDEILMFPPSWIQFTETSQDGKRERNLPSLHSLFALNPYQKQLWKVPKTPFISSSQHQVSCMHPEKKRGCSAAPPGPLITAPHMIGLFDQISLSLSLSMNAWLHLALPCVERAEQVSSEMSGRKESSEIMTGAAHNVENGKRKKENNRGRK